MLYMLFFEKKIFWILPFYLTIISIILLVHGDRFKYIDFLIGSNPELAKQLDDVMTCHKYGNGMPLAVSCCSCDLDCSLYGSCCADAFWNFTYSNDMFSYKKKLVAKAFDNTKKTQCEVLLKAQEPNKSHMYYMVSSCMKNAIEEDAKACRPDKEDLTTYIPVLGNDNYLYRNLHCAKCNFVKEFVSIEIRLVCEQNFTTKQIKFCEIDTQDWRVKTCHPPYEPIRNCSRQSKYHEFCHSFKGPVGIYANYYCYLCNKDSATTSHLKVNETCRGPAPPPIPGGISWSSLLRFTESKPLKKDVSCRKNDIFDAIFKSCIPINCPSGYKPVGTACKEIPKIYRAINIIEANFDSCIQQQPIYVYVFGRKHELVLEKLLKLIECDRNSTNRVLRKTKTGIDIHLINVTLNNETFNLLLKRDSGMINFLKNGIETVISSFKSLENFENISDFQKSFQGDHLCAHPLILDMNNVSFYNNCDIRYREEKINYQNITMWIQFNQYSLKRNIVTCRKFYLQSNCPLRILSRNITLHKNGTLIENINGAKMTFDIEEYRPYQVDRFAVCIVKKKETIDKKPYWLKIIEFVEGYMSVIGSGISMVCYIATIITFGIYKRLQNVPGLCTMSLCINLFISDGLFFVMNMVRISEDDIPKNICKGIGVLMHYTVLAAYLWGLVISFDFFLLMTRANAAFNSQNKSKFVKYSVFAISLPIMIIAISMLLNHYEVISVQYEKEGICAIHGYFGRIVFLLTPLLIALLMSIILVTVAFVHLAKENTKNQNSLSGSAHQKTDMRKIALKMILICGLPEIIGFVQIADQTEEAALIVNAMFGFIYSFIRAFRGVFLFVVYICSKVVMDLFRSSINRRRNRAGVKIFNDIENKWTNVSEIHCPTSTSQL